MRNRHIEPTDRPDRRPRMRRRWLLAAAAGAIAVGPHPWSAARAQDRSFPDRPLRLIVPFPPGGNLDMIGRMVAERMGRDIGQTVVVENRPGANQIIGTQAVASARPDGYTLGVVSGASLVLNPLLYRRLPYDPERDLAVIAVLLDTPFVAVVTPDLPVRTLQELAAYSRARPGKLSFASAGSGNTTHLAAELFRIAAKVDMEHVPYNGSAPALTAMLSGDVQVMFDTISTALPLIRENKLRPLAVTTARRLALLPEVPTVAESGFPGYQAATPVGIAVPKQTPAPVMERLRAAAAAAQSDPDFRSRMESLGLVPHAPMSPADISQMLSEETTRWSAVIRARGIVLD